MLYLLPPHFVAEDGDAKVVVHEGVDERVKHHAVPGNRPTQI